MSSTDDIYLTSRCIESELRFELSLNLRPESEEEARQLEAARAQGQRQVSIVRFCPYCERKHSFEVELPPELRPEHLTPRGSDSQKRDLDLKPLSLVQPDFREPSPRPYHRTAANAAARYNKGGRWVRKYDEPDLLKRALVLLDQAIEIYHENDRPRDAAYAATLAAEGRIKLSRFAEARKLLDQAFPDLQDPRDQHMLDHWHRVEKLLRERAA